MVTDRTVERLDPVVLSALVGCGAATTFAALSCATGGLDVALSAEAWLWLACVATVSTAVAVVCFFAGLARVGPGSAAILSAFEPIVTVALAYAAFGERLAPVQAAGAGLVLGAVVALQRAGRPSRLPVPGPADADAPLRGSPCSPCSVLFTGVMSCSA